jgi:hypothetical protein
LRGDPAALLARFLEKSLGLAAYRQWRISANALKVFPSAKVGRVTGVDRETRWVSLNNH